MRKGERRYVAQPGGDVWVARILGFGRWKTARVEWLSGPLRGREACVPTDAVGEEVT